MEDLVIENSLLKEQIETMVEQEVGGSFLLRPYSTRGSIPELMTTPNSFTPILKSCAFSLLSCAPKEFDLL